MPFVKGQSGNPSGGSKKSKAMKDLAARHGNKAIKVLAALLDHEDPAIQIKASDLLLDRGYGRPSQSLEGNISGKITLAWEDDRKNPVQT
jgi:hypothetical protein